MEKTLKANFCFGLLCKVGYVGPKILLFFSFAWVGHMDITI
jgi:hypothetical protein